MDRRRFLYATGLTGLSVAVAGCSGGENEQTADDGQDGRERETNPEQAETLIDSAGEKLDEVETKFGQQLNEFDQNSPESIETTEIESLLDEAKSDLDSARAQATDEQRARIEALAGVLEFFRSFVNAVSDLSVVLGEFQTADGQIQNEEWNNAVSTLKRAEQSVSGANTHFENARSELDGIDSTKLDEETALEFAALERDLDDFEGFLFALDVLVTATRQFVEGIDPLEAGQSAFEAGNYSAAADSYSTAEDRFSAATQTLTDGAADVPAQFQSDVDQFICQFGAFEDVAEHLNSAAQAQQDGQSQQAQDEVTAAQNRLEEAENC